MKRFLITLLISVVLTQSWAQDGRFPKRIIIQEVTSLREVSFFASGLYLLGFLNPGDKASILSVDTNHTGGVAFQVKVETGVHRGKIGWIYFHKDPEQQRMTLLDKKGKQIRIPTASSLSAMTSGIVPTSQSTQVQVAQNEPPSPDHEQSNSQTGPVESVVDKEAKEAESTSSLTPKMEEEFSEYFQKMSSKMVSHGDGKASYPHIPKHITKIIPDDEIWQGAINGEYQIDLDRYQGGEYIPFTKKTKGHNGHAQTTTYWARSKPRYLTQMPEKIAKTIRQKQQHCRDSVITNQEDSQDGAIGQNNWLPYCDVLARQNLGDHNFVAVSNCLQSIKDSILKDAINSKGNINRNILFKNLYSKLNPKEQQFAAMTITSFGEAGVLAPPLEEMVMVMKVLNNRTRYAREEGYENANELDAALQSWQFSMYNRNDPNWKRAFKASNSNPQTINAVGAYILYQNTTFSNESAINHIYHYHTNYVSPTWRDDSLLVRPVVNGRQLRQSGTRHKFYRNIPWSFGRNPWSGK